MNALRIYKEKTLSFVERNAQTAKAEYWLAITSFSEASFFILPPDVMLVAMLMYGAEKWVRYASLATLFSVFGGLFGYFIGVAFFDVFGDLIIRTYGLQDQFIHVSELYQTNAFVAVFVSAFTPIPYKIFTITAGVFNVSLLVFILASFLGRGLRFFLISFIMKLLGKRFLDVFTRYFNTITLFVVIGVILILIF